MQIKVMSIVYLENFLKCRIKQVCFFFVGSSNTSFRNQISNQRRDIGSGFKFMIDVCIKLSQILQQKTKPR